MADPSYFFTLFKKFQILGHLPENDMHGTPGGSGTGFDLTDPNSTFTSFGGTMLGSSPANSPLWAMLNAAANGQGSVTVGGTIYPSMPTDTTTAAWNDFQVNPASHKLVDTFGDWINAGKTNDVPTGVIGTQPSPIGRGLDSGVSPFVCSFATDDGIRPGGVPNDYWETSLIFLVNPSNGQIVSPSTLNAGKEYYLTAVIGNRGQSAGGLYSSGGVKLEARAIVMVWNTVFSPGVELPALSNLNVGSTVSLYGQYFLDSAQYDVVGFRLNVQDVYDGIVAELNDILAGDPNALAGLTAEQWVKAQPAHLCAKVVVRQGADSFPNVGDTPINTNKIGQRNLAPFDINLTQVSPDPNIVWKNFIVGQPFFLKLGQGAGRNTLIIEENLNRDAFVIYVAISTAVFKRYFEGGGGTYKGFKVVAHHEICDGKLGELAKPFPHAVILRYLGGANAIEFPALAGEEFLAMSLGIEYSVKKLKAGHPGKVKLIHKGLLPRHMPGTMCFELKEETVGGFTIVVNAKDPRQISQTVRKP